MDQEQLIRNIMSEVMKNLGNEQVTFKKSDTGPQRSTGSGNRVGVAQYPLAEKHPEMVVSNSGRKLTELTFDKVKSGDLKPEDFRISPETLELQAQVAEDSGRPSLARNLRRAAELVPVADERLLAIYDALRPYRSTKQELYDIASELESKYSAKVSAGFIREAADVYEARGRLRGDD
ncbi:diol dehydratase small subunit [Tessaracoccus massiliensis]|uniref:diol dehydratase small subunit n=1 Tax=Tessaracoccus massiliensis TaxID=1522311 RepID=UPI00058C842A|nr:diol dehydratase small subunit [Tessaracoccus massiliensis]